MVQRHHEEMEARGWADVDTIICSQCVVDAALVNAVRHSGGTDACDYCGKAPSHPEASSPFEVVLERVVDGLKLEYEDPVEGLAWDGGYVGNVHDTWDLLWELEITEREDVHRALNDAIVTEQWCQREPYAATPTEALTWGWEAFGKFVKHRRRFTFLASDDSTADGAGMIPIYAIPARIAHSVAEAGLIKELPVGSEWWRVRPHPPMETWSTAKDLGTPPDSVAKDNRMTPKGIGAFYGASSLAGARAEVAAYAVPTHDGSFGVFTTTTSMRVVDLRGIPEVPSLFDPGRRHLRAPIQFLRGFAQDATQVADPTDWQNLDYVPTQVIAETFRYDLLVDGVLWHSSKDETVTSCVLFVSNEEVVDTGGEVDSTRLALDCASVGRITAPL